MKLDSLPTISHRPRQQEETFANPSSSSSKSERWHSALARAWHSALSEFLFHPAPSSSMQARLGLLKLLLNIAEDGLFNVNLGAIVTYKLNPQTHCCRKNHWLDGELRCEPWPWITKRRELRIHESSVNKATNLHWDAVTKLAVSIRSQVFDEQYGEYHDLYSDAVYRIKEAIAHAPVL